MKIFDWIKEHPVESGGLAIGLVLVIYLVSRSSSTGSTSAVSDVANAQLQQASLANQNAAVQASAQAQENQDALAAQVQNNTVAAELASTVSNNQAGVATDTLAANVQNNQTEAQENVANNTINAELEAQQSQVAAESQGLTTEFHYLTDVNNNATSVSNNELNLVTEGGKNGGIFYGQSATTNEALLSALALAQPGGVSSVPSAENALYGTSASDNAAQASIINSIIGGLSTAFSGLFA